MASHGSDNSLCLGGGELSGLSSQEGSLRLLLLPLLPDGSKKMQTISETVYCESGLQELCVSYCIVHVWDSFSAAPYEVSSIFFLMQTYANQG